MIKTRSLQIKSHLVGSKAEKRCMKNNIKKEKNIVNIIYILWFHVNWKLSGNDAVLMTSFQENKQCEQNFIL